MISRHEEHSFDLDLLLSVPGPIVVDVGCRGFSLPRMLAERGAVVSAFDLDPRVEDPGIPGVVYYNAAVLGSRDLRRTSQRVGVGLTLDPAATFARLDGSDVPALSIRDVLRPRPDLLKLDCEGSEYAIMEDLAEAERPLGRQISVEYHDHCGILPPGGYSWFDGIAARLSRLYTIVKHEREVPPWCGLPAFVDCLYIAKEWNP